MKWHAKIDTGIHLVNKPFILDNTILNYHWGTANEEAFIPILTGHPIEPDLPYAELWMGSHPKAPSVICVREQRVPLDKAIRHNPPAFLGQSCTDLFGPSLPFLFKVLSASQPLSIQVHPDKSQARLLHQKNPNQYPDVNHKPEMAIALDGLTALAGFRPFHEIRIIMDTIPEFTNLKSLLRAGRPDPIRSVIESILDLSADRPDILDKMIQSIEKRLRKQSLELSNHEKLFISLRQTYVQPDPGLVLLFFLNWIHLNPHQAFFLPAGMPHAYIRGNILECMANSDNVVRAGLTPKFRDIESVKAITRYEPGLPAIYTPPSGRDSYDYPSPVPEFQCFRIQISHNSHVLSTLNKPVIMICMNDRISLAWQNESGEHQCPVKKGESVLVPAVLNQVVLQAEEPVTLFAVTPRL
jgi:mannose-6-phosphate isomerase